MLLRAKTNQKNHLLPLTEDKQFRSTSSLFSDKKKKEKKCVRTGAQATAAKTPTICGQSHFSSHIVTLSALTAILPSQVKHICHSPFCLQSHARIIPPVLYLALILFGMKNGNTGTVKALSTFPTSRWAPSSS